MSYPWGILRRAYDATRVLPHHLGLPLFSGRFTAATGATFLNVRAMATSEIPNLSSTAPYRYPIVFAMNRTFGKFSKCRSHVSKSASCASAVA